MRLRQWTLSFVALTVLASDPSAPAQCQLAGFEHPAPRRTDRLGFKVALAGSSAIIAVPFENRPDDNTGSVFVLERAGAGWQQAADLTLPDPMLGDALGWSLAAVEDRIYAGSFARDSVFVFERAGAGWTLDAALMPASPPSNDAYPWSVAAWGDRVVAGAPLDNGAGYRAGAAYVFERDPNGTWRQAAKLLGAQSSPGDRLGESVAIHGGVVVCGAPESDGHGTSSGAAYVFEPDPNGTWRETARLLPDTRHGLQFFGQSVAVDNGVILVGAYGDNTVDTAAGAAYAYERDAQRAWVETARLVASDGAVAHFFGISLALDGDLAAIGAENADTYIENTGAVYVFHRRPDASWAEVGKVFADDGQYQDEFGRSVALRGNVAVVGAPYKDRTRPNGTVAEDVGAAYVFAVGPDVDGDGIMDACICPGDVDGDFVVDVTDLVTVLSNFGRIGPGGGGGGGGGDPACQTWPTRCAGDLDRDGDVDISDVGLLLAHYGDVCP